MKKVVSSVPQQRFERFKVSFPGDWEVSYISSSYTEEDLIEACKNASYLLVMSVHVVSAKVIQGCSHLKMIHVEGVGFDKVDTAAAKVAGIPVCNNRAVNNAAVAEHTIGLILAGLRRTADCDARIKTAGFASCQKQFFAAGQHELQGQKVGLVGIGAIGKEAARRLKNWGCEISYYDVYRPAPEVEAELDIHYLPLEDLIKTCDIISLHVPVTPETFHLLSRPQFEMMKKNALVINTARGEIIDPQALADALEKGLIYGAALDTMYPEPVPPSHPLLKLSPEASRRLTLTPHAGGTTDEAFTRMLKNVVANMIRTEAGDSPINVVN